MSNKELSQMEKKIIQLEQLIFQKLLVKVADNKILLYDNNIIQNIQNIKRTSGKDLIHICLNDGTIIKARIIS